jgi:hypothetical protein
MALLKAPVVIDFEPGDAAAQRPGMFTVLFPPDRDHPDGVVKRGYMWLHGGGHGVRWVLDDTDRFSSTVLPDDSTPTDANQFDYPQDAELPSEQAARVARERTLQSELNRQPEGPLVDASTLGDEEEESGTTTAVATQSGTEKPERRRTGRRKAE